MKKLKPFLSMLGALVLIFCLYTNTLAVGIEPYTKTGTIISVAHGGNGVDFPAYSLEAINSAFELGADCVSVCLMLSQDEKFVVSPSNDLTEISADGYGAFVRNLSVNQVTSLHLNGSDGQMSQYTFTTLEKVVASAVTYNKILIIDADWMYRQMIFTLVGELGGLSNVILRADASKGEVKRFLKDTGGGMMVIGTYHGNILFSARSNIKSFAKMGCSAVCLGTKNSYGVIFHKTVMSAFSTNSHNSRAMIKTYELDECGQRSDTKETWSDVIDRGYSIIETDRIQELVSYINELYSAREKLTSLVAKAQNVDYTYLSKQSAKDVSKATEDCSNALGTLSSLETLNNASYSLTYALNHKTHIYSLENTSKQGVLQVTGGKLFAVISISAVLLFIQIFVYFMRADKKFPTFTLRSPIQKK